VFVQIVFETESTKMEEYVEYNHKVVLYNHKVVYNHTPNWDKVGGGTWLSDKNVHAYRAEEHIVSRSEESFVRQYDESARRFEKSFPGRYEVQPSRRGMEL
jgi:hypothetical protein